VTVVKIGSIVALAGVGFLVPARVQPHLGGLRLPEAC
jgi:hypothetical protein